MELNTGKEEAGLLSPITWVGARHTMFMKTSHEVIGVGSLLRNGVERLQAFLPMLAVAGLLAVGPNALAQPTVTITSPRNNIRVTNDTITVAGTARGGTTNDPLAQVALTVNGGTNTVIATGVAKWTATVNLEPGSNVISAVSSTGAGVQSVAATRVVRLSIITPLTVLTNGPGLVVPNLSGRSFADGTLIRLRAVPQDNAMFIGWTGATNSTNATINFVMTTNAVLTANFTMQPFFIMQGAYSGLILNDTPTTNNSGFFTLNLNRSSSFSGRVLIANRIFPITGRFDTNGAATFSSRSNLSGTFQLDMSNQTGQVTGTVTGPDFTSPLIGNRSVFDGKTKIAPFAGLYNMVLEDTNAPSGDGFATINVSGGGVATVSGKLPDGSILSQSTPVAATGDWPLFATGRPGTLIGWMTFTNLPITSISGTAHWFKPPTARIGFVNGVDTNLTAIGSLVIAPPRNIPLLNWTNGEVVLSGDDFMMPLTNMVVLRSNNTFVSTFQLNSMRLTTDSRGLVRGTFIHPVTQRTDAINGVLLPKISSGAGFFLETNGPGVFVIQPIPQTVNTNATNFVINPPATLGGYTLELTPTGSGGSFRNLGGTTFVFTPTNVTSDATNFGTGTYSYSSQPSDVPAVAELDMASLRTGARSPVIRMLLNFTSDTTGSYVATIPAGTGSGTTIGGTLTTGTATTTQAGTFTITPPTPVTPPPTP